MGNSSASACPCWSTETPVCHFSGRLYTQWIVHGTVELDGGINRVFGREKKAGIHRRHSNAALKRLCSFKAEGEAEDIVARACESIGLPKPASVILTPVSIFIGSPHAHDFPPLPKKIGKTKALHTHAVISFSETIQGPILLGAGRYRGYGLCRPYKNLIGDHDG